MVDNLVDNNLNKTILVVIKTFKVLVAIERLYFSDITYLKQLKSNKYKYNLIKTV